MKRRCLRFGPDSGFSLLELLLVSMAVPIVALAVYANFSSGIRIWETLRFGLAREEKSIFFQKVSDDLRSTFKHSTLPFVGDAGQVSFAGFLGPDSGAGDARIGQIGYSYDAGKKSVLRQTKNLSQVYQDKPARAQVVLMDAADFNISYFYHDPSDGVFKWQAVWDPRDGSLPIALRFRWKAVESGRTRSFERTFAVLAGG